MAEKVTIGNWQNPVVHDTPDEPCEWDYEPDDPWCTCCAEHSIEELDTNCCDSCGKDIEP